jgi:hypothetical protein
MPPETDEAQHRRSVTTRRRGGTSRRSSRSTRDQREQHKAKSRSEEELTHHQAQQTLDGTKTRANTIGTNRRQVEPPSILAGQ